MNMPFLDTLKGHFLIAMPGMEDPNFFQSVVCLCDHTPEGAMGVVINRVHASISGKNIFSELKMPVKTPSEAIPLYIGGPVRMGDIYLLHGPPFDWESTIMAAIALALSNSVDVLQAIALGRGPESFMVALGCAGWGPGQLENEIRGNVWLTSPVSKRIIFETPPENRWAEAVKGLGVDPAMLSDKAGHA
jgi:putative transcriptional regulator